MSPNKHAMSSMGLPISANGVPPVSASSNFGQPSGVAIGPASGQFGGVTSSTPAPGYQNTVGPRSNVRFQVQPTVTVAVRICCVRT